MNKLFNKSCVQSAYDYREKWLSSERIYPLVFSLPKRVRRVNRSIDWQLSVRANCFIIGFVGRGKFGGDEKAGEKLCINFPSFLFLPFWKISHEIRRVDIFTRILEKETIGWKVGEIRSARRLRIIGVLIRMFLHTLNATRLCISPARVLSNETERVQIGVKKRR